MQPTDSRLIWLCALRERLGAPALGLYERPPFNGAVRMLSAWAGADGVADAGVRIEGAGRSPARGRLEVRALEGSSHSADEQASALADIEIPEAFARWNESALPPPAMLVSGLLHDLKSSLGAQSLLLGTAERELRAVADGTRATPRLNTLVESITLCRESVAIATDRAQLSQWLVSPTAPPSMSGETWLRLAVAGLTSEERDRLDRSVSPEARSGPEGDPRSLVSVSAALCAMGAVGDRSALSGARAIGSVMVVDECWATFTIAIAGKCLDREQVWRAAIAGRGEGGARAEALIGLAEALASSESFEFASRRADGTRATVRAKRSSGVLR
jgi:hypothetical protein